MQFTYDQNGCLHTKDELHAEREAADDWGAWGDGERWAICGCVGGGIWGA